MVSFEALKEQDRAMGCKPIEKPCCPEGEEKKLWLLVPSNTEHKKNSSYKLLLSYRNWNDFGYYTIFYLFLSLPSKKNYNMKMADLYIFNIGQKSGEEPDIKGTMPFVTYIGNIESALMIVLFLTPKERQELITSLNIKFECDSIREEPAFIKSVLRGTTKRDFVAMQCEIEKIMTSQWEISKALEEAFFRMNFTL